MYLVDTNVWLERLLDQERANTVGQFLDVVPSDTLAMTDFAFHSIAVIMCRLGKQGELARFIQDVFEDGAVGIVTVEAATTTMVLDYMSTLTLDFDDAYQYTSAEKYDLTIVSFDKDFDSTPRGRMTPAAVLASLNVE